MIQLGDCSVRKIKLTTKASGKCKIIVKIAVKDIYASQSVSRTLSIVAASATITTTSISPTNSKLCTRFPNLSAMAGVGAGNAKPSVAATCSATQLTVKSNGMISYALEKITPNAFGAENFTWTVPVAPVQNSVPTSIVNKLGALGFANTGLPIYGPTLVGYMHRLFAIFICRRQLQE